MVSATVFVGLEVGETRLGEDGIDGDVGDLRRQIRTRNLHFL